MSFVRNIFRSVGRIFSPPRPQAIQPPPLPPPPADPTPQVPPEEQRAVEEARERQRRAALARQNRSRTILTGTRGLQTSAEVRRTTLGGS